MLFRFFLTSILLVCTYAFFKVLLTDLIPEWAADPAMYFVMALLVIGSITGGTHGLYLQAKNVLIFTWPLWIFPAAQLVVSLSPLAGIMPADRRDTIISVISPALVSVIGFLFWRFARFQELARDVGIVLALIVHVATIGFAIQSGDMARNVAAWAALSLSITFLMAAIVYLPPLRLGFGVAGGVSLLVALFLGASTFFSPVTPLAVERAKQAEKEMDSTIEADISKVVGALDKTDSETDAEVSGSVDLGSEFAQRYRAIIDRRVKEEQQRYDRIGTIDSKLIHQVYGLLSGGKKMVQSPGLNFVGEARYPITVSRTLAKQIGGYQGATETAENLLGFTPEGEFRERFEAAMGASDALRLALKVRSDSAETMYEMTALVVDVMKELELSPELIRIALARAYILTYGKNATCITYPGEFDGFKPNGDGRIGWEFAVAPAGVSWHKSNAWADTPVTERVGTASMGHSFFPICTPAVDHVFSKKGRMPVIRPVSERQMSYFFQ